MDPLKEKRRSTRYPSDGLVTLFFTPGNSQRIEVRLLNFNEYGLGFFSEQALIPGTTVIVRASEDRCWKSNLTADCQIRNMGLATIKWCKENERQGKPVHEMGAVYHVTY